MTPDISTYLKFPSAAPVGFSPDGSDVLVLSNLPGTAQLFRIARAGGLPRQITDFGEPVTGTFLPTSDEIVVSMDAGGNEHFQLYLMNSDGTEMRKLLYDPDFIHSLGSVAYDGSLIAYVSNSRNGVDFDIYIIPPVEGAEPRRIFELGGWCRSAGFSPDGRSLAVIRQTERNGDSDLHLVDLASGSISNAVPHDDDAVFGEPAWLPDSSGFFFSTDCGRDRAAIGLYDMRTHTWRYVLERAWDCRCAIDRSGTRLLITWNEDGYTWAELVDPGSLATVSTVPLPVKGVADFVFSNDGRYLAYCLSSPRHPGDAWLYDIEAGETRRLTTTPASIDVCEMVDPEVHRITSFDGEQVPVFVYRPTLAEGPGPVLLFIHGGPETQFRPGFQPLIQYFVAHGYTVVAPNVRGSTGYGKRYHHLDDVRKRLDAVADLASIHEWLRHDPHVDATRAALWGASYGGYMVLSGLAFQPDLWAAGVSIAGISSLVTFLENTAEWRRAFREREYGRLAEDRDFLLEASPLTHVEQFRAPLMLIHGRNDPRVPIREAQQIHQVLSDKGVPSELFTYGDEGHGLGRLTNRLDAYPRAAQFLERVLNPQ